jgi:hypothetical protein
LEIYFQRKKKKNNENIRLHTNTKIERATKLDRSKVGVNYLRYYSGKIVDSGLTRDKLDEG